MSRKHRPHPDPIEQGSENAVVEAAEVYSIQKATEGI